MTHQNKLIVPSGVFDAYDNYITPEMRAKVLAERASLPTRQRADQIKHEVRNNPIVITVAETGAGKSTQIPPIAHEILWQWRHPQIDVTLPRVIPAISLATRISVEMLCETGDPEYSLGKRVGYRTGKESLIGRDPDISINTDGLQIMRMFHGRKHTPDILMIDEVHEQSVPTSMLLALVKRKLLSSTRDRFKLILSSATLNAEELQDFFAPISRDIPLISIPGRTFPIARTNVQGDDFIPAIIKYAEEKKNVLVFVEGKAEIAQTISTLRRKFPSKVILALHSEISPEEQQVILNLKPDTNGAIIVSTNVAESSITLPYINAVVDRGQCKVMLVNSAWVPELRQRDISLAARTQRGGRAGRTGPWEATTANDTPLEELDRYPVTPIEHSLIERYILVSLAQGIDLRRELVGSKKKNGFFLRNPDPELVRISYENLQLLGAIDEHFRITEMWLRILQYPLEPKIARMLVEGIDRGCARQVARICAIWNSNGFLGKQTGWKGLCKKQDIKADYNTHLELLDLITTRNPSREILDRISAAVRAEIRKTNVPDEVKKKINREFGAFFTPNGRNSDQMLYERVDLSMLGIKKRRVDEIVATIERLEQRITSNEEELSDGRDEKNILLSILSGSLSHIFRYGEKDDTTPLRDVRTTKKSGNGHRAKKGANETRKAKWFITQGLSNVFLPANTSTVVPSRRGLYIGFPLIVESHDPETKKVSDIAILTNITRILEDDLRAVRYPFETEYKDTDIHIKKGISSKRRNEKYNRIVASVRESVAGLTLREEICDIKKTADPLILARDWLPGYLIWENLAIRKFIRELEREQDIPDDDHNRGGRKSWRNKRRSIGNQTKRKQIDLNRFRELLRKITVNHAHRIDPRRPAILLSKFMHDTQILQEFKDSHDSAIMEFLRGF